MKLTLIVAEGVHSGKPIPIRVPQFVIGRDPSCQLRPASGAISKQHCVFFVKADKAMLRDLQSTNGTFVNGERLEGEVELKDGDTIKAGPLVFTAKVEKTKLTPVDRPTPVPPTKTKKAQTDDDIAAMLMEVGDDIPASGSLDSDGIPTGTTVFDMPGYVPPPDNSSATPNQHIPKKPASSQDNSSIAAGVLEMYRRKKR
jgi:pSer/pThr/pTyr-binding forkhead associated (FHA) protein